VKKVYTPASRITALRTREELRRRSSEDYGRKYIEGKLNIRSEIGVVIPTYCEARTIGKLIQEIESLGLNVSILIVDDSSPDGTADIARELQKKYDNILLFVRPKKSGLGTAILDGFRIFMRLPNPPKYVITMDADYSHNPKDILTILRASHQMHGLVVGSRYVKGGKIIGSSFSRIFISRFTNIVTSIFLGGKINDCTCGFRGYPTRFLKYAVNDVHGMTYEVQIRALIQARKRKFSILEVPIMFESRKKGKSQLSIKEIQDFTFSFVKILQEGLVSISISWRLQSSKTIQAIISKVRSLEEIIDHIIIGKRIAWLLHRRIMHILVSFFKVNLS
jgi:dolichol-phosphate mannosyltransferase